MKWKTNNGKTWRRRFAWFPLYLQGYRIWLEYYDSTGWYYSPEIDDGIKSFRYPSKLK